MFKPNARLMTAALIAIALPVYAGVASAAPISGALAIQNAAPANIETVRWGGGWGGGWRGGGWRGGGWGRGWGWGLGGGLAAGAIIGSALAAPYYYGGYYGGGPYYAAPYYAPGPGYYDDEGGGGDGVAYCMQRYRTYDPRSGTFRGNDGYRHPCP